MVRKIRKSPFAFPLASESSDDGEGHGAGEASAVADASQRQCVRPASQRSKSLEPGAASRGVPTPLAETRVGEHIARELRGIYEPIVAQPTPDRFLQLLNRLERGSIYREKARAPKK
jgi:hypothetical protein